MRRCFGSFLSYKSIRICIDEMKTNTFVYSKLISFFDKCLNNEIIEIILINNNMNYSDLFYVIFL